MTAVNVSFADGAFIATLDGVRKHARVIFDGGSLTIIDAGRSHRLTLDDPLARASRQDTGAGHLFAPMPGVVTAVLVQPGDVVERNQPLMILEAMKKELTIKAPAAGRVDAVHFRQGQQVKEGDELLTIAGD